LMRLIEEGNQAVEPAQTGMLLLLQEQRQRGRNCVCMCVCACVTDLRDL